MTNPPYMLGQLSTVAKALRHPNVFAFLHVPVQAAADPVLKAMNREYTRAQFEQVADALLCAFEETDPKAPKAAAPKAGSELAEQGRPSGSASDDDDDDDLGFTLATDIICGFPGETDKDFEETVKLVEK